ncbi:MAG: hypothetical protein K2G89_07960 [Lachnospiraceae bacterium]|nr:hypothetical protein [Lachnospiraceae bacterium]
MKKSKKAYILLIIFLIIIISQILLWGLGWYSKPVWGSGEDIYILERTKQDMETGAGITDWTKAENVRDCFAYFDGLQRVYEFSLVLSQGSLELAILDIGNATFIADGMEFEAVQTKEVAESGVFSWEIIGLEKGHWYALAVYGSEDSLFSGTIDAGYRIFRWQYLHDKWLSKLPFIEEKYYPQYEIIRANDW